MFCAGQVLGRRALPFNSLAAAALVVLALNPADLFSVGAQLSFLSVAGILWYAPLWSDSMRPKDPLDRLLLESRRWPSRLTWRFPRGVRNVAVLSAVVWLLTLPLVTARFHVVALTAIALSVLLWIPAFVGLATGFALLAVGWLCWPLAVVLGWCCDKALWALDALIGMARTVPGSCLWVRGPSPWWLVGFYGGLGVLAAFPALRPSRRWCLAMLAGWSALGLLVPAVARHGDALQCTVLSVGHGCAVVVQLPSGQTLLYDAGKLAAPESGMQSVAACLWAKGVTHLNAIVLSHADADHYNAVPELIRRFSVEAVYVSPVMFAGENRSLAALEQALRTADIPIREICAGDCLVDDRGCRIEVLHPPRHGVSGKDNANSVVLGLQCGGRRMLLPGDLESPGLEALISQRKWHCDVLLAPHHGSRLSRSPELAAWCKPQWVVISGSRTREPSGAVSVYRDLGCQVLHTSEVGAVEVQIEEGHLEVSGFLDRNPELP
jgi:competence protein ComEC